MFGKNERKREDERSVLLYGRRQKRVNCSLEGEIAKEVLDSSNPPLVVYATRIDTTNKTHHCLMQHGAHNAGAMWCGPSKLGFLR